LQECSLCNSLYKSKYNPYFNKAQMKYNIYFNVAQIKLTAHHKKMKINFYFKQKFDM